MIGHSRGSKDNHNRYYTGGGPRPDRSAQKRKEAAERLERWQKLSPAAQLAVLAERPGNSTRQRARILENAAA